MSARVVGKRRIERIFRTAGSILQSHRRNSDDE